MTTLPTPRPRPGYDAGVRAQAASIRGAYGLGHARALVSVRITQSSGLDRAYRRDVLDVLDEPATPPVSTTTARES